MKTFIPSLNFNPINGIAIIDDNKIADNEGALSLLKGYHTIKIKNFYTAPVPGARRRSNPAIRIYMIAPGTMDKKLITADMLYN